VKAGVDHEVPYANVSLVPIRKNGIGIGDLVGDLLVEFAAFELHLLLKELVVCAAHHAPARVAGRLDVAADLALGPVIAIRHVMSTLLVHEEILVFLFDVLECILVLN